MNEDLVNSVARTILYDKIVEMLTNTQIVFDIEVEVEKQMGPGSLASKVEAKIAEMLDPNLYNRSIDMYFSEKEPFQKDPDSPYDW